MTAILRHSTEFSLIWQLAATKENINITFPLYHTRKLQLTGKAFIDYAMSENHMIELVLGCYGPQPPTIKPRLADNWWRSEQCFPILVGETLLVEALTELGYICMKKTKPTFL